MTDFVVTDISDLHISITEAIGGKFDGKSILILHPLNDNKEVTEQRFCITEESADMVIEIIQKFKRIMILKNKGVTLE